MSESSCLQFLFFSLLFSFSGVLLFALIARAVRVFIFHDFFFTRFAKFIWRQKHFTSSHSCRRNRLLAGASSGQMSSEAEQQQQSCSSVWLGYPSPSLLLLLPLPLTVTFPLLLSLTFLPTGNQPKSLPNCTKSLHCLADTLCACLRVERKWNACVECKQHTKATSCSANCLTTQVGAGKDL